MRLQLVLLVASAGFLSGASPAPALDAYATAEQQQAAMTAGVLSAEALVRDKLDRITALDRRGPKLNSVIALSPEALTDARVRDAERAAGRVRGPLHGLPVLVKDNIETADGSPTTAGSLALADNVTRRDAPLVERLEQAGAVILGKANLSEWANFRSTRSVSGWSAVGGLVRNPHALDRNACGSSSGSAVAVAAGYVAAAIGTETDGSITCPAAVNGIVGFKPTVGLVSRTGVVPISPIQDTPGPMTRSVRDAALVLNAIAGSDPADPNTGQADRRKGDYAAALRLDGLKGVRIGVLRNVIRNSPQTDAVFETALKALKASGAVLVEVKAPSAKVMAPIYAGEGEALEAEFKAAINAYLADTPAAVKTRSLADLIAFNAASAEEMAVFGQEIFETSEKRPAITDRGYIRKRAATQQAAIRALTAMLSSNRVTVLVAPTGAPAWIEDTVNGTAYLGSPSTLPAVAGTPHLTVPMGFVEGLPVGLSIIGAVWSDAEVLAIGYAFEQATKAWRAPQFLPATDARPHISRAYDPQR